MKNGIIEKAAHSEIFQAVIDDNEAMIEEVISRGGDPNGLHPLTGGTPLHTACSSNQMHAIEALLRHGADPNKRFTYKSPVDGRIEKDLIALLYTTSPEAVTALLKA